ncbi:MAG: MFS transporter [Chloroflexi bacterium]|nr:MFS transporter [Chloroflexota bacterium]
MEHTPSGQTAAVHPLDALRYPAFRLLWGGTLAASLAQQVQWVASSYLVYEITGSPFLLGLTGLFRALPLFLFSLAGGALADAVDRRKLLLITQSAATLISAGLTLLALESGLEVWHLYAATFLTASTSALFNPSRMALVPRRVPPAVLMNAVTFNTVAQQSSMLVGPVLAGLIVGAWGAAGAYGLCALGFGISVAASIGLPGGASPAGRERPGSLASVAAGVRFVGKQPALMALLALDFGVTFLAAYRFIMPVFAKDILGVGPEGLGLLLAAPGAGALVGSVSVIALGNVRHKGALVLGTTALFGLGVIAFSGSTWVPLSVALAALLGYLDSVSVITRNTIILLMTPDALRGRVQSVVQIVVQGSPALAGLQVGTVAALIGAAPALALGGLLCLGMVGLVRLRVPALWHAPA